MREIPVAAGPVQAPTTLTQSAPVSILPSTAAPSENLEKLLLPMLFAALRAIVASLHS